ncbi:MAG: hypothetical protein ACLQVK_01325 [Acidimicrobiales bacterium]
MTWPGHRGLPRAGLLAPAAVALVSVLGLGRLGASGTPALTVGPGDGLTIQGSNIECVVSIAAPRAIVCGIGQKSLLPHSYAFTVADKGAAIFGASGSQEVVARQLNPALSSSPFPVALHKPTNYVLAKHAHVILGGTHIACASLLEAHGVQTFGCGAYDTASGTSGYYVAGSYAVTISDQFIGILEAGKLGAQSIVAEEKQP